MGTEGDVFEAIRLDTSRGLTVRINDKDGSNILVGSEPKSRVSVSLNKDRLRNRSIHMVRKTVDIAGGADKYYWAWKELKDAGIPTIPTVRKITDSEVVITDMTQDGSAFFGKADVIESYLRYNNSGLRELDKVFLSIDLDDIEARARVIVSQANLRGITLPVDDPMDLLIHPDGSWEIVVLDIDSQMKGDAYFATWNNGAANKFVGYIRAIRKGLSSGGKPPSFVI